MLFSTPLSSLKFFLFLLSDCLKSWLCYLLNKSLSLLRRPAPPTSAHSRPLRAGSPSPAGRGFGFIIIFFSFRAEGIFLAEPPTLFFLKFYATGCRHSDGKRKDDIERTKGAKTPQDAPQDATRHCTRRDGRNPALRRGFAPISPVFRT